MDDVDEIAALVPGAHRMIRRLGDGGSAFCGALVSDGERQRVSVDASAVDDALWQFAAAEHVAGVRDIVRSKEGQEALLPWCADSLDVVLARRETAGRPLAAGEIVTLVGSLLRGIIEVAGREVRGRWWLDDETRPLFVPGEGVSCADASVEIIGRIRRECTDRALERVLGRITNAAADHRVVLRLLDEWERELTEHAAPRAIDVAVYAPELAREIPAHRARLPQDVERLQDHLSLRERFVARRVLLSESLSALRARAPRAQSFEHARSLEGTQKRSGDVERPPRRRMLLVGAAVAGVVLIGGLLWPTGGEDSSAIEVATDQQQDTVADAAEAPVTASAPASAPTPPPTSKAETPEEVQAAGPDALPVSGSIEDSAAELLKIIGACRAEDDAECEKAVVAGAGQSIQDRLGDDSAERELSLIEDYGDIAVVRLGRSDANGEQMLVIARLNDEWLVRDVYDVADQPSDKG